MKKLLITLPENLSTALGYTLLHSLWQGVLILIMFLAIGHFLKTAHSKYALGMTALFLQLFVSAFTFSSVFQPVSEITSTTALSSFNTTFFSETLSAEPETTLAGVQQFVMQHHSKLTWLWLVGVGILLLRMGVGFLYTKQLKTAKTNEVAPEVKQKMRLIQQRLGITETIGLLESLKINVPLTIGWLKPVILFPAGMLTHLPMDQIEAILAHELAHIKRKDYLFNILQNVVETIFFFHPAVWILSARIRTERENCCDDVAIEVCQNKIVLANALAEVASYQSQPMFSMAFGGQKTSLLCRIKRIVGITEKQTLSTGNWLSLTLFLCLGAAGWTYASDKKADLEFAEMDKFVDDAVNISDVLESTSNARAMTKDTFPMSETELKMEKLGKEINSLSAEMNKYSEKMQDFSKEMHSPQMEQLSKEMQQLSKKMEKPSSEIGELAKEVSLLSLDVSKKRILKEDASSLQKQLDKAQGELQKRESEMHKISEEMNKVSEKMNLLQKPMEDIHRKMEKQRIPMDSLSAIMSKKGEEMSKLGEKLRKEHEEMARAFGELLKKENFIKDSNSYFLHIVKDNATLNGKTLSNAEKDRILALIKAHFRQGYVIDQDDIKIRSIKGIPAYSFKKDNLTRSFNWNYAQDADEQSILNNWKD